jgi:hypothetical protein
VLAPPPQHGEGVAMGKTPPKSKKLFEIKVPPPRPPACRGPPPRDRRNDYSRPRASSDLRRQMGEM